jgi:hypothetical protein
LGVQHIARHFSVTIVISAFERSRDRELSPEELRIVWLAADRLGYPYGSVTKLLILTLQRPNEVAQAPWTEFLELENPEKALWKIPRRADQERRRKRRAAVGTRLKLLA